MTKTGITLRGVFTPIVTSFDEQGRVAHDQMAFNLERWNQTALGGYIVLGSNGEWVYLNEQEKIAVLETATMQPRKQAAPGRSPASQAIAIVKPAVALT